MTSQTKSLLIEYLNYKSVHSTLNLTFEELLTYVFDRIQSSEYTDEIIKVLNIEMPDSVNKCFTGNINCLNGFDPLVCIQISESEQITQVITLIKKELMSTKKYTIKSHQKLVIDRLISWIINQMQLQM